MPKAIHELRRVRRPRMADGCHSGSNHQWSRYRDFKVAHP